MKTWNAKTDEVERNWWIVDATDMTLGRMANKIATVLRGKHKPTFTPHIDTGDFVVVINSDKVAMSGNKWDAKKYFRHSGYFGGIKELTAAQVREQDSTHIIRTAVYGMLPKNKLSYTLINKLKIYPSSEHPHFAQKPQALQIKGLS